MKKGDRNETPLLVRLWLSGLQDGDEVRRQQIKRTHVHEPSTVREMLAELDAKREREAPVATAWALSVLTVAVPIGGLVGWLVAG
jgi:hypothetical protein